MGVFTPCYWSENSYKHLEGNLVLFNVLMFVAFDLVLYIYKFILQKDLLMFITMSYKNIHSVFLKLFNFILVKQNMLKESSLKKGGDLPGGPVVKVPCFHCRRHGSDPWWGNLHTPPPCVWFNE